MKNDLITRVAETLSEKEQLIALRTKLYRQVRKHEVSGQMLDEFDANALHIGVWKNNSPIATVRILERSPACEWEHDRFLSWPSSFPPRENTVEMSRLCIVPTERSLKTFQAICAGIAVTMLSIKKRYVVACCTNDLVGLYKDYFGAVFTGHTITHSDLGPKKHQMFICDMYGIAEGQGINLGNWSTIWARPTLKALYQGKAFKTIDLIFRLFDIKIESINADKPLISTNLDSLSVAELLFAIEDEFQVRVDDEVDHTTSFNQLVAILESKISAIASTVQGAK